jgi:hypothetical protein
LKKQITIIGFIFLGVLCSGLAVLMIQKKALERKIEILEKEIQSLKVKFQETEQKSIRLLIESKVSRLRQLAFLKEPLYRELKREQIRARLLEEIEKEFPLQKLEKIRKVLVTFGFIDSQYDLTEGILSIYSEQIGAFYDVDEKALFNIQDQNLGPGLQDALLAHELTHVLQDQHFDIKKFLDPKSKNDDRELAIESLIEGDATFMTQLYYLSSVNLSIFWDILSSLFIDQKEFNKAPMVLRENMMFPYMKGLDFITFLHKKNGWNAINECFRRPPASTEEIIHPSKYLLGNDPPQKLVLPPFKKTLSDYSLLLENVLGEFNIQLLFKQFLKRQTRRNISEGWGGDIYQLWEDPRNKSLLLIWFSVWDTATDAYEFFTAYRQLTVKKFPQAVSFSSKENFEYWKNIDRWILVAKHQDKILIIEADEKETIDKLLTFFKGFKDLT